MIYIFRSLKEHPAGKQFATDSGVQHIAVPWLKALDTDFFHTRTDALVSR
jgi:hypothetical protein